MGIKESSISGAVEGLIDEAVLRRLVMDTGGTMGPVYGKQGKEHLLLRLPGFNAAAIHSPWVVLVDLDRDAECAAVLRRGCLPAPAPFMCFRIAVREVETWLLADREELARFVGVPVSRVPVAPESLQDPKQTMIEIARHSRRRAIREDMVPRPSSGRIVGPAYVSTMIEFATTRWRPEVAMLHSDSLRRCMERIRKLVSA